MLLTRRRRNISVYSACSLQEQHPDAKFEEGKDVTITKTPFLFVLLLFTYIYYPFANICLPFFKCIAFSKNIPDFCRWTCRPYPCSKIPRGVTLFRRCPNHPFPLCRHISLLPTRHALYNILTNSRARYRSSTCSINSMASNLPTYVLQCMLLCAVSFIFFCAEWSHLVCGGTSFFCFVAHTLLRRGRAYACDNRIFRCFGDRSS